MPSICRASWDRPATFKAKGVDTIACMAVNDVFVMGAWGKHSNVGDNVLMLADGNGDYAKALGLEMDGRGFGMGTRGQRFARRREGWCREERGSRSAERVQGLDGRKHPGETLSATSSMRR